MPQAAICLDCNRLYPPPADHHAYGRCPTCRTAYIQRKPRGQHRNTPTRQIAQRFYTSTAWRKVRDQVRARDGACTNCGSTSSLTVHHIASIQTTPELALDPANLVTLCRACHGRHENTARRKT